MWPSQTSARCNRRASIPSLPACFDGMRALATGSGAAGERTRLPGDSWDASAASAGAPSSMASASDVAAESTSDASAVGTTAATSGGGSASASRELSSSSSSSAGLAPRLA